MSNIEGRASALVAKHGGAFAALVALLARHERQLASARAFRADHQECVDEEEYAEVRDELEEALGEVEALAQLADIREHLYWDATRSPGNTLATIRANPGYMALTETLRAELVTPW